MTIVAAWLSNMNSGQDFIECVSDSQVTHSDRNSTIPLLNTSAKIFNIPIIARCPSARGFFEDVYHVHSVGMAFSGSSLIGLNLSSTLASLTSQLGGIDQASIPSLNNIADLAIRITRKYVFFLGNANNGQVPLFHCAILGWCRINRQYQLIHFGPTSDRNPEIKVERFNLERYGPVFLMGDNLQDIERDIVSSRSGLTGIQWDVVPKQIVEKVIRERTYPTIGGGLQRGRGLEIGFQLIAAGQPIVYGEPAADILFRGLSIFSDIGAVGPCVVSMNMSA